MSTVYLLMGLPGSGKSTFTKRFVKENHNMCIVNRDMIRTSLKYEYVFDFAYEDTVAEIANSTMSILLKNGYDVIVDETHIKRARRLAVVRLAGDAKVICVAFKAENNLKNRMTDGRGYDESKWRSVIEGMKKTRDPVNTRIEHFDEFWFTEDMGKTFVKGKSAINKWNSNVND